MKAINGFLFAVNSNGKVLAPTNILYPYQLSYGFGLLKKAQVIYSTLPIKLKA